MEKLGLNKSFFEVSLNKYDDLLVLNCSDLSVFEKFKDLYDNVDEIAKSANKEIDRLNAKAEEDGSDKTEDFMDYVKVNVDFSTRVLEELDKVFGDGFTKKVFREHYELNPDYVPDEIEIAELLESLIPIMEKAYGERIKRTREKYNPAKRGKRHA